MPMTPVLSGGASKYEAIGANTAASTGTAIAANATPGSDGAWTQISAAIANDWYAFTLFLTDGGTIDDVLLVDVAIGGAGSEFIILADLPVTQQNSVGRLGRVVTWFPLYIAKGNRVSARVHRAIKANSFTEIMLIGDTANTRHLPPYQRATTYGTVLASARGTSIDPGAVANTQGANTEIVASTTNPILSLYVFPNRTGITAVTVLSTSMLELFVGAGGSEVSLMPEFRSAYWEQTGDFGTPMGALGPVPVNLPAGTRISAKTRSSNATATERLQQVTLVGLD